MGEVTRFDVDKKRVYLQDCFYEYDYLVVATGVTNCYYGNDSWEEFAPGLKTLKDALCIREKILVSFEKAECTSDKDVQRKLMTFVVVGAGPTGVEIAGSLAELSKRAMRGDYKRIETSRTRIVLIEALDRVLYTFDPTLSTAAQNALERLGVEIQLNKKITNIDSHGVWMKDELIETQNILWAAGTMAPPLVQSLGASTDRAGRLQVERDLSIKNHPEVFAIGDVAQFSADNKPLPALAPVAVQQGKYVADIINRGLTSNQRSSFKYKDKGILAVIGRAKGVLQSGRIKLHGFPAWLAWVFIHIMVLVQFRNRYKVLSEWIWYYFTNRHGVRLITGQCLDDSKEFSERDCV